MKIRKALVVDDSEGDQMLTKLVIEDFDATINVFQAYDGQEGLDMLLASPPLLPDVIFLDVNMPGMGGHEFLEEYSKLNKTSTVVLMLSSSDQEIDKQKSLQYSFVKSYIEKPVILDILKELSSQ